VLQAAGTTVDLDAEQHAEHAQDRALIARCNSAQEGHARLLESGCGQGSPLLLILAGGPSAR
jgi:hypothetical protein